MLFFAEDFEHFSAAFDAETGHRPSWSTLSRHGHLLGVFHIAFLAALYTISYFGHSCSILA